MCICTSRLFSYTSIPLVIWGAWTYSISKIWGPVICYTREAMPLLALKNLTVPRSGVAMADAMGRVPEARGAGKQIRRQVMEALIAFSLLHLSRLASQ